ncbi:MAG: hypothetical protein ACP5XB_09150 [Isosphaeraceae bacterium]
MNEFVDSLKIFAAAGAGGGVAGAISHDQILTWSGAAVAVGSALVTAAVAAYHKYREARRDEDTKDRRSQLEDIRKLTRVQADLESRISRSETAVTSLSDLVERVRCRYPNPDGTARCSDPKLCPPGCHPEPKVS